MLGRIYRGLASRWFRRELTLALRGRRRPHSDEADEKQEAARRKMIRWGLIRRDAAPYDHPYLIA